MAQDSSPIPYPGAIALLGRLKPRLDALFTHSSAPSWQLSRSQFVEAIETSVAKRFAESPVDLVRLEEYLGNLHVDDLVLATACMQGSEAAWEHFVTAYRGYLRAAAGMITKGSKSGSDAQELADSLFAELFGLVDGKRGEASLLRYFHGRSSLKTWLRTVLAQRHIDCIRQGRRWESIEHEEGEAETVLPALSTSVAPLDPHRSDYLRRFLLALHDGLDKLDPGDRRRLELYYAREKTLAEIGKLLGEHESSASRHLERTRRELRAKVEECLRTGLHSGDPSRTLLPMTDQQIALCFQYAAEDAPIDFRQIFPEKPAKRNEAGPKESL